MKTSHVDDLIKLRDNIFVENLTRIVPLDTANQMQTSCLKAVSFI